MDKNSIGNNAGIVWRLLNSKQGRMKYEELKRESGLSDRELNAAIGWLAREDKILFEMNKEGEESFFLSFNVYF